MSCTDESLQPLRVRWDRAMAVGHPAIDAQHQALLAHADRLADLIAPAGDLAAERLFVQGMDEFRVLVRRHFEQEAAHLGGQAQEVLDDHWGELEDFESLVDEISAPGQFDTLELQRFLALWCLGHVNAGAPTR